MLVFMVSSYFEEKTLVEIATSKIVIIVFMMLWFKYLYFFVCFNFWFKFPALCALLKLLFTELSNLLDELSNWETDKLFLSFRRWYDWEIFWVRGRKGLVQFYIINYINFRLPRRHKEHKEFLCFVIVVSLCSSSLCGFLFVLLWRWIDIIKRLW